MTAIQDYHIQTIDTCIQRLENEPTKLPHRTFTAKQLHAIGIEIGGTAWPIAKDMFELSLRILETFNRRPHDSIPPNYEDSYDEAGTITRLRGIRIRMIEFRMQAAQDVA